MNSKPSGCKILLIEKKKWFQKCTSVLGCKVGSLPMSHLELPLGLSFKAQGLWNVIIEKLEKRSSSWKKLYFSKGGRVTLLRKHLSSIPTYFISFQQCYLRAYKLEKYNVISCEESEFYYHLLDGNVMCYPANVGGLDVCKLKALSIAREMVMVFQRGTCFLR